MNEFIRQKTQEISFVLLRLAAYVRRFDLRKKIENLSYHLVENVYYQNTELALQTIDTIGGFLLLGKNIYEIEPINVKIITQELESLTAEIKRYAGLTKLTDLQSFFSAVPTVPVQVEPTFAKEAVTSQEVKTPIIKRAAPKAVSNIPAINPGNNQAIIRQSDNAVKSLTRQTSIVDRIRQSDEKRLQLKDIIAAFPNISERTLRYDLKILCDSGKLYREGNGGPGNYYSVRQSVPLEM